jgi:hypothetical protein
MGQRAKDFSFALCFLRPPIYNFLEFTHLRQDAPCGSTERNGERWRHSAWFVTDAPRGSAVSFTGGKER